jgi:hypothetical protein
VKEATADVVKIGRELEMELKYMIETQQSHDEIFMVEELLLIHEQRL